MDNVNTTFGGQSYTFNIVLWNSDGQVFQFTPSNIVKLIIEDSITDIFTRGEIIIKNSYDIIFRTIFDGEKKVKSGYNFRGDGKDYLHIEIYPTTGNSEKDLLFPDFVWKMSYDFAIYEVIDIPSSSQQEKSKKFLFWDKTYQELFEKTKDWSTVDLIHKNNTDEIWNLSDEEKRIEVGKIIKYILSSAKGTEFTNEWENGNTKLFYTSHNSNSLLFDFWYILGKYLTENNDYGILRKNRHDKKWSLKGLSKYFQNASKLGDTNVPGLYQIEHIYLDSLEETSLGIPSLKSPSSNSNPTTIDIKTYHPIIGTYEYTEMSPKDNNDTIVDFPVHGYDWNTGTFSVLRKDTKINNINNYIKENYINYLKTYKNNNYSNIIMSDDKVLGKQVVDVYSFGIEENDRLADSRNSQIYNAIFLNSMLKIKIQGSTHRQAGRFIAFDRENDTKNIQDHDIDNKLLGQWFLSKVIHSWDNGNYTNILIGNKCHNFYNKSL